MRNLFSLVRNPEGRHLCLALHILADSGEIRLAANRVEITPISGDKG